MKKKIFTSIAALLLAGALLFAIGGYIYGFILSCGQTIYRGYDYPLSDTQLAVIHDQLEEAFCEGRILSVPNAFIE